TTAYEDLVKIITHFNYCKEDVVKNIRRIRKWRSRLPLLKVCQHNIPIYKQQTPSTVVSTKKAFTISPLVHLKRILNNPTLVSKMYFGPGVIEEEKYEFWHGDLWQDSPLFGKYEIKLNNQDSRFGIGTNALTNIVKDPSLCSIFLNWYATENTSIPIILQEKENANN
ncbi:9434_t:CDS:2, partial [Acaulospora morrowiae]